MKKFKASVILSLLTGRLYCDIGDIYDINNHICGQSLMTHHLPVAKDYIVVNHLDAFPRELADISIAWQHTDNWRADVQEFDEKYGEIDVPENVVDQEEFGNYMVDNSLLLKRLTDS